MAAGTIYPDFPGKGAESGWYRYKGSDRYWTGNEFRYSGEGRYNVAAHLGSFLTRDRKLSPEAQARSDAQKRFNEGTATDADRALLRGERQSPAAPATETPPPSNTFTVGGVTYDSTTRQAINPETGKVSSTGYSIGSDGSRTDSPAAPAPAPQPSSTGRNSDRVAPDGSRQTGTQMGPSPMTLESANALLAKVGANAQLGGGASSNNLPGTGSYEIPNIPEANPQYIQEAQGINLDGQQLKEDGQNKFRPDAPVVATVERIEPKGGGFSGFTPPTGESGPNNSNSPNNNASLRWDSSKYEASEGFEAPPGTISNDEMARRRAFLDSRDSLAGLRAVEAQQNIIYAGGQYNVLNPNRGQEGEGDFGTISKGERDQVMRDEAKAQDFLTARVEAMSGGGDEPAQPSTLPEPAAGFEKPVPNMPKTERPDVDTSGSQFRTEGNAQPFQADPPKVTDDGDDTYKKMAASVRNNPFMPK